MIKYIMEMEQQTAHYCLKAVELLMRLKINQPEEISRAILDYNEKLSVDEYCDRRDKANEHLEKAFREIFRSWDEVKKDDEWYILYNIYQALRYQIHLAEHPESTGVDSYPPRVTGGQPIPNCRYEKF